MSRPAEVSRTRGAAVLALLALVPAGCRSFASPRPETLSKLQPMPLARLLPGQFEVELNSPGLSGIFDAVVAVEAQQVRMQLFPDVGGKVLDLTITADTVIAELPGSRYEAKAPLAAATPHLALVFAAVLGELLAPVAPVRVLGERPVDDGAVELLLRPALGSGRVVATISAAGVVTRYTIALGWLEFTLDDGGVLHGRGFSGRLRAGNGGGAGGGG